jgi:hypothetical protein
LSATLQPVRLLHNLLILECLQVIENSGNIGRIIHVEAKCMILSPICCLFKFIWYMMHCALVIRPYRGRSGDMARSQIHLLRQKRDIDMI